MISGGMIPKVETCLEALEAGAKRGPVILDGPACPMPACSSCFTEAGTWGRLIRI